MSERYNCKGYVLCRWNILVPEKFVSIKKVCDLSQWFVEERNLANVKAISVIEGSKWQKSPTDSVVHMLSVEGADWFSHRKDQGYPVEFGTYLDLISRYIDERAIYYLLYLGLK